VAVWAFLELQWSDAESETGRDCFERSKPGQDGIRRAVSTVLVIASLANAAKKQQGVAWTTLPACLAIPQS
jgi:hypothetical protein